MYGSAFVLGSGTHETVIITVRVIFQRRTAVQRCKDRREPRRTSFRHPVRTFVLKAPLFDYGLTSKSFMRLPILLPLLFLAASALGQETPIRRWTLGVGIGAGMGYRALSVTAPSTTSNAIIDLRNEREEPLLVLGGHLGANYQLKPWVGLDAGVGYAQMGWRQQVRREELTFGDMIDPRRGFIYTTEDGLMFDRIILSDVYHFLDMRLGATVTLGQGRWRWQTSIGVAPAVLIAVRHRSMTLYEDGHRTRESREPKETFNSFNLFPYFATGLSFHPGGRWIWQLQPAVRYGVLRIIDAPITAHLFSGTLEFGVRYTL